MVGMGDRVYLASGSPGMKYSRWRRDSLGVKGRLTVKAILQKGGRRDPWKLEWPGQSELGMCVTSHTRGEEAEEVLDPDSKEPEIHCLMLSHRYCRREKEKPTKMLSLHYPKE